MRRGKATHFSIDGENKGESVKVQTNLCNLADENITLLVKRRLVGSGWSRHGLQAECWSRERVQQRNHQSEKKNNQHVTLF